jgi:hypothetical protein
MMATKAFQIHALIRVSLDFIFPTITRQNGYIFFSSSLSVAEEGLNGEASKISKHVCRPGHVCKERGVLPLSLFPADIYSLAHVGPFTTFNSNASNTANTNLLNYININTYAYF